MGGLVFCTLLTLVFIPVIYEMVDRKRYAVDEAEAPARGLPELSESGAD
jgi:hypothetical protein